MSNFSSRLSVYLIWKCVQKYGPLWLQWYNYPAGRDTMEKFRAILDLQIYWSMDFLSAVRPGQIIWNGLKMVQIKSNQILRQLFDRSNWNKLIWFEPFLGHFKLFVQVYFWTRLNRSPLPGLGLMWLWSLDLRTKTTFRNSSGISCRLF